MSISSIIHQLEAQRRQTVHELEKLNYAIKALESVGGGSGPAVRRKPVFSKAGLERIAAAQRARWAKIKRQKA